MRLTEGQTIKRMGVCKDCFLEAVMSIVAHKRKSASLQTELINKSVLLMEDADGGMEPVDVKEMRSEPWEIVWRGCWKHKPKIWKKRR
jgi:hypothetical protein